MPPRNRYSQRIIPACAGSRRRSMPWWRSSGDHPRVCGEQLVTDTIRIACEGSSPRVRGAESSLYLMGSMPGIIPACAGSSLVLAPGPTAAQDHPRVCGEQVNAYVTYQHQQGSSPRVRGAGMVNGRQVQQVGIIPACAGSRRPLPLPGESWWDHPRVCGEQHDILLSRHERAGSSPRVRGAALVRQVFACRNGIIPACAGSRQRNRRFGYPIWDHPRVCGEQTRDPQLTIAHPSQRLTFQSVCERAVT